MLLIILFIVWLLIEGLFMLGFGVDIWLFVLFFDIDVFFVLFSVILVVNLFEWVIICLKLVMLGILDVDEGREFDRVLNLKIEEKDEVFDFMFFIWVVIM